MTKAVNSHFILNKGERSQHEQLPTVAGESRFLLHLLAISCKGGGPGDSVSLLTASWDWLSSLLRAVSLPLTAEKLLY